MPDIIALCETHIKIGKNLPAIPGYKSISNNYSSDSAGTAIYIRIGMKAEQLENPDEEDT